MLAGSSSLFDFAPQSAPEVELSSTQRDTSEVEAGDGSATENSVSPLRHRSPSDAGSDDEDEDDDAPTKPVDAFAKLMAADQRPLTKHQKQAKERIRSNLVDEQADESDEDNWLMPGQKNDDDEEEGEDQDAFLPELVNDEEISEEDRERQDALVAAKNR
jgi:mediator of replication checkpoint protein 1